MSLESGIITAAVLGDLHLGHTADKAFAERIITKMAERADVLLFTGDLIHNGRPSEAAIVGEVIHATGKPSVGVLGNHERRGEVGAVLEAYESGGLHILEGRRKIIRDGSTELEVLGLIGGYDGSLAEEQLPEREGVRKRGKRTLDPQLEKLSNRITHLSEHKSIILTHFATTRDTIYGEDPEKNDLHGSLAISTIADMRRDSIVGIFHGHTHRGGHLGRTPLGIPVFNVALPVLGREAGLSKEEVHEDPPVCVATFSAEGLIDVFVSR